MRYSLSEIKNGTGFAEGTQFERVENYNGWTNRETWAVALHINNDQGWQESVLELVRAYMADRLEKEANEPHVYGGAPDSFRAYQAGEIIKENVEQLVTVAGYREMTGEDHLPAALSQVAEDIGSLYRVNWDEIGAAFLSDVADQ